MRNCACAFVAFLILVMAGAAAFDSLSPEDVVVFLKDNMPTLSETILKTIVEQKIDGEAFMALDDSSVREIAPLLGDRLKIKRALDMALSRAKTSVSSIVAIVIRWDR